MILPKDRAIFFLKMFLSWTASAVAAYFIAVLSINVAIIETTTLLIFICFISALFCAFINKSKLAIFMAASPTPLLIAGAVLSGVFQYFVTPILESEPYTSACLNAEESYFTTPEKPIRSIAYDWEGDYDPGANTYKVGLFGRLTGINRNERLQIDNSVTFTERRRGNNYGAQITGAKYVRQRFRDDSGSEVETLTADILVTYHLSPEQELSKAATNRGPVTHEILVTDRRSGQRIASLRYVIDQKNWRICGPIKNRILSEDEFLLKALKL